MKNIAQASLIALASLLSLSVGGCASSSDPNGANEQDAVGDLKLALQLDPDTTINSVHYSIAGADSFTLAGDIDVTNKSTIYQVIPRLPVGEYSVQLSAGDVDGGATCSGTAEFEVRTHETTAVTVKLQCKLAQNTGSVVINGEVNLCPEIEALAAVPFKVQVGQSVEFVAEAVDVDDGPSPLSYSWTSTSGAFSDASAANPTFTATQVGEATLTLTVSDGDCSDSWSLEVEASPSNVLLIVVDDLGAEATSLYSHLAGDRGAAPVPTIEKLAEGGLVFDNVWASPMCSPTRSTIMTGSYGHRTGVTTAGNTLPTSTTTVFDRITAESPAPFGQALFGKYHLAGNNNGSTNLQHVRDLGIPNFRGYMGASLNFPYDWTAVDINGPSELIADYSSTAITNFAIDYINNHESNNPKDPWFVWQAYNAVHEFSYYVPPANLHSVDLGSLQERERSNTVPNYQAILQSLDTELGRLLAEVDLETTTVILIGDNGVPANGVKDTNTGLRGTKTSVYEGGVRVPLIVAGAGVTRRGHEEALVTSTDLFATILSLAGVSEQHVNNSYSLTPLLTDEDAETGRTYSFTELCSGPGTRRYAIRDQRYKLLFDGNTRALYDLQTDPKEATNLYTSADHATIRAGFEVELAALKAEATAGCFN